jgi:phosphate transport system substrate-binding protein
VTMRHITQRAGVAMAAAVLVAACGQGGASGAPTTGPTTGTPATTGPSTAALSGTVTIDGSSTVFPITEVMADEFGLANPDVDVPLALSGTGGGFKLFCGGDTDINNASRPIKAADEGEGLACEANGIEYVELQIALDGVTVTVNPANTWATCLTVAELARIYGPESPEELKWSDVRTGFPETVVERYMPGADSGTFDFFTEVITGEVDAATTYATTNEDDNVLVTGVAGDSNAIGFFGFSYYNENTDKLKSVEVDNGSGCIAPTQATINDNTYAPLSRPLFIYPDVGKAKERPELKAFVDYYLANTQAFAAEEGFVAMPDDLLAAEVAEWEAAVGG